MANDSTKNIFDILKNDDDNYNNPNSFVSKKRDEKDHFYRLDMILMKISEIREMFIAYLKKRLEDANNADEIYDKRRKENDAMLLQANIAIYSLGEKKDIYINQEQILKLKEMQDKYQFLLNKLSEKIQKLNEIIQMQHQQITKLEKLYEDGQKDIIKTWSSHVNTMLSHLSDKGGEPFIPLPKELQNRSEADQCNGSIKFAKLNYENVCNNINFEKVLKLDGNPLKNLREEVEGNILNEVIKEWEKIIGPILQDERNFFKNGSNQNSVIISKIVDPLWDLIRQNKALTKSLANLDNIQKSRLKTELELKKNEQIVENLGHYRVIVENSCDNINQDLAHVNTHGKMDNTTINVTADSKINLYSNQHANISSELDYLESIFAQSTNQIAELESGMDNIMRELEDLVNAGDIPQSNEKFDSLIAAPDDFINKLQEATNEPVLKIEDDEKHNYPRRIL